MSQPKTTQKQFRFTSYFIWNVALSLGLIFLVLLLVFITNRGSNRLLSAQVRVETATGAASYDQVISFEFTRPLAPELRGRIAEFISFEPEIKGVFRAIDRTVIFSALEPLGYDTTYTARVSRDLKDSYGKPMAASGEFTFKTKQLQFLYATKAGKYQNLELGTLMPEGRVERVRIASDVNIREYAASAVSAHIIYTVQNGETKPTDLYHYDLAAGTTEQIELPVRLNITAPVFSKKGELMFIGTMPDEDLANLSVEELPENFSLPYSYNLDTGELAQIDALGSHFGDISAILPAPDGNSVLIQKFNFDIVAVSLLTGESTPLGKYTAFGGFNFRGDRVGVLEISLGQVNFFPRAKVLGGEGQIFTTGPEIYARDPQISPVGDIFAYSIRKEPLELSEGRFGVEVVSFGGEEGKILELSEQTNSIELSRFSPTGDYLSVEIIPKAVLENIKRDSRIYLNPGRPTSSQIKLYDFKNSRWIELGIGYNLLWIK